MWGLMFRPLSIHRNINMFIIRHTNVTTVFSSIMLETYDRISLLSNLLNMTGNAPAVHRKQNTERIWTYTLKLVTTP